MGLCGHRVNKYIYCSPLSMGPDFTTVIYKDGNMHVQICILKVQKGYLAAPFISKAILVN